MKKNIGNRGLPSFPFFIMQAGETEADPDWG